MGTKDIINTSAQRATRAKEAYLPEEMDHLAHRAIFTTAKAKTNTGQVLVPRLKEFPMWVFFFFHCHRSFGEVHLRWESFKFLVGTSPFSEWPYTYLESMLNGYHACTLLDNELRLEMPPAPSLSVVPL